jgi:hypothetical protein
MESAVSERYRLVSITLAVGGRSHGALALFVIASAFPSDALRLSADYATSAAPGLILYTLAK